MSLRTLLPLFFYFTVRCLGYEPLTEQEEAQLRHYIEVIQQAAKETTKQLNEALGKNKALLQKVSDQENTLANVRSELSSSQDKLKEVQKGIDGDKSKIRSLETKVRSWEKVGHVFLALVFGVVFFAVWGVTGGVLQKFTGWVGYAVRVAVCAAAGTAAASSVFYAITRFTL